MEYEIRKELDGPSNREATFIAPKKTEKNKWESRLSSNCCCEEEEYSDEEVTNFVRKLKIGIGKFKGKLLLMCFNCGRLVTL